MDTIGNMFKALVTAGWANESDGDVESVTGHFAIIDMSTERDMMRDVCEEMGVKWVDGIAYNWFTLREDSQGFMHYEATNERGAHKWFNEMQERYSLWHDED
jgi:hypothetical protein